MTELKSNAPKHIDTISIQKLDNGYCVEVDTTFAGKFAHYCSNLKGVTKALWLFFEGKKRLTRKQEEGLKGAIAEQQKKLDAGSEPEEENA